VAIRQPKSYATKERWVIRPAPRSKAGRIRLRGRFMHEVGIAQQVIEVASEKAGGAKILRIVLEIGSLSGVMPDAVRFCFDACAAGTAAEGAKLEIIEVPGRARCEECGAEVALEKPFGRCTCGNSLLQWLSGDELRLRELEVD
jgi:hydrogenase nickel incorporation protein HypA/HybF